MFPATNSGKSLQTASLQNQSAQSSWQHWQRTLCCHCPVNINKLTLMVCNHPRDKQINTKLAVCHVSSIVLLNSPRGSIHRLRLLSHLTG